MTKRIACNILETFGDFVPTLPHFHPLSNPFSNTCSIHNRCHSGPVVLQGYSPRYVPTSSRSCRLIHPPLVHTS